MSFRDPEQFGHMRSGVKAALKSPRTPAHLLPHLKARLGGPGLPPAPNPLGNPMVMAAQALKGANIMNPIKPVPPRKAMPGSFGGSNGARPRAFAAAPSGGRVAVAPRNPIGRTGNLGKSTSPMPPPATGPANPVLENTAASGNSQIVSGGMGQTGVAGMPKKERGAVFAKKRGSFFGG